MELVRATHSGAKTILAHFHYCCKGEYPFRPETDWNSPKIREMAQLDAEQAGFMASLAQQVQKRGKSSITPNAGLESHRL